MDMADMLDEITYRLVDADLVTGECLRGRIRP